MPFFRLADYNAPKLVAHAVSLGSILPPIFRHLYRLLVDSPATLSDALAAWGEFRLLRQLESLAHVRRGLFRGLRLSDRPADRSFVIAETLTSAVDRQHLRELRYLGIFQVYELSFGQRGFDVQSFRIRLPASGFPHCASARHLVLHV